jgi:hypothetical protein
VGDNLPKRWVVRVVYPGGVGWLRHGPVVGTGPIVRFHSKRDAQIAAEMFAPGLDPGCTISVVSVGQGRVRKAHPPASPAKATAERGGGDK